MSKVLSRWDWSEGVEEAFTPNGAELLPQVKDLLASSPEEGEKREEPNWPAWQAWKPIGEALANLFHARARTFCPWTEALRLLAAWEKWLKPYGVPLPLVPVNDDCAICDRYAEEEAEAYKRLEGWLTALRWVVDGGDLEDITRIATGANDAWQVWLMMAGMIPVDWSWVDSRKAQQATVPARSKTARVAPAPVPAKETTPPVAWWVVEQLGDKFPSGDKASLYAIDELHMQLRRGRRFFSDARPVSRFDDTVQAFLCGLTLWLSPCGIIPPQIPTYDAIFEKPVKPEEEAHAFRLFSMAFTTFRAYVADGVWWTKAKAKASYPELAASFNTWLSFYIPAPTSSFSPTSTPAPRNIVDNDIDADLWHKQMPGSTNQQRLALVHAFRQNEKKAQKEQSEKAGAALPSAPLEETSDDWIPVAELRAAQLREEEGLPPLHTPVVEMEGQDPDDLAPAREDARAFFFDDETPTQKILFPELYPELPLPAELPTPVEAPAQPLETPSEPVAPASSALRARVNPVEVMAFGDGLHRIHRTGPGRGFVLSTFSLFLLALVMSGCVVPQTKAARSKANAVVLQRSPNVWYLHPSPESPRGLFPLEPLYAPAACTSGGCHKSNELY